MENLTKTVLNFKEVFGIPNSEVKKLSKDYKEQLKGVNIRDSKMYITDSFYAMVKPFEHKDAFFSFIDGKEGELEAVEITKSLDEMIKKAESRTAKTTFSVELLSRVLAVAKEQNNTQVTLSIDGLNPMLIEQGEVRYLVMPINK